MATMAKEGGEVYAFIDGANLHQGIQELGWKLDYKRFRVFLRDKFHVSVAYLFIGQVQGMEGLYRDLQNWGYRLVFKPTLQNAQEQIKGNCDAELVLQAMIDLHRYEKAVIVTGDGDFACLVSYLQKERKLAAVISPHHRRCSRLLRRLMPNGILFLDQLKERLKLRPQK